MREASSDRSSTDFASLHTIRLCDKNFQNFILTRRTFTSGLDGSSGCAGGLAMRLPFNGMFVRCIRLYRSNKSGRTGIFLGFGHLKKSPYPPYVWHMSSSSSMGHRFRWHISCAASVSSFLFLLFLSILSLYVRVITSLLSVMMNAGFGEHSEEF